MTLIWLSAIVLELYKAFSQLPGTSMIFEQSREISQLSLDFRDDPSGTRSVLSVPPPHSPPSVDLRKDVDVRM